MAKRLIIASFIWVAFPLIGKCQSCKIIEVVPYIGKDSKIDKFKLSKLVADRFKSDGFLILDKEPNTVCSNFRCEISHTEHYWQVKKDTVTLTLYDSLDFILGRYIGVTNEVEWTFKSAYTKATYEALDKIRNSDVWK